MRHLGFSSLLLLLYSLVLHKGAQAFAPRQTVASSCLHFPPPIRQKQHNLPTFHRQHPHLNKSTTELQSILARSIGRVAFPMLSISAISSVVLVHELGHYLAARLFNIDVVDFSVGMGPRLFGFHKWGNQFSFRALPLGGYVEFVSEENKSNNSQRLLENSPWYEQAVVASGGVVFNVLLSYCLFMGIFIEAGVLQHTTFVKLARYTGHVVTRITKVLATGLLGLLRDVVCEILADICYCIAWLLRAFVGQLMPLAADSVIRVVAGASVDPFSQVSGPINLIQTGSAVARKQGTVSLAKLTAFLSLNVGVFNAMPLPVLDGGRLLFALWEGLTGRPVHKKVETTLQSMSALFLFYIIVTTSFNDIFFLFAR